ncbi:Heterokaryon incompatibility protein (HET) domain containing protein, partial [Rhypophila decipiens]
SVIYSPLDPSQRQIRLARLSKGKTEDPLSVKLVLASLDSLSTSPSYEALSYVWGSTTPAKERILNGHTVDITPNLHAALSTLRSPTHDRLLWVDAICINQKDPNEQSEQVRSMRDVYSSATRTLVWLGVLGASREAMEFLATLETHASPAECMAEVFEPWGNERAKSLVDGLYKLIVSRPYWNRRWIIQELVCSTDILVYCGSLNISLEVLKRLPDILEDAVANLDTLYPNLSRYRCLADDLSRRQLLKPIRHHASDTRQNDLLTLLRNHRPAECSNLNYRIYALLGISTLANSTHPGLEIDYSLSTTAARAIIDETSSLDILCSVAGAGRNINTGEYQARQPFLPSWAPDWNIYSSTFFGIFTVPGRCGAAGDTPAKVRFVNDGLIVEGLAIAEIFDSGVPFVMHVMGIVTWERIMKVLFQWREKTSSPPLVTTPFNGDGESLMDKFYRLLDSMYEKESEAGMYSNESTWARWWMPWWVTRKREDGSIGPMALSEQEKWGLTVVQYLCVGRRLFFEDPRAGHTRQMNIGLCPKEAEKGDVVCVILGCSAPIVLRPVDDHFVVVGAALVLDFMQGEALEGTPASRTFTLR